MWGCLPGDGGPGGQQLVGIHRLLSWPRGDCAVIVRADHLGVIPEDDMRHSGRSDEAGLVAEVAHRSGAAWAVLVSGGDPHDPG